MLNTPYRMTTADQVVPGAVVEVDGSPFVVDEVRRNLEGIDLMGWPRRYAKRNKRVRAFVRPADEVKILANDEQLCEIRAGLIELLSDAVEGDSFDNHRVAVLSKSSGYWFVPIDPCPAVE